MGDVIELKKRIKRYEAGLIELQKKFGLNPVVTIAFPQYKKLPFYIIWALKILRKRKAVFMLTYKEDQNAN